MDAASRVVKIGGSLLEWERLGAALRCWLDRQPPAANVLIVGGGRLADEVRRAERRLALGQERAHWLCVDLLSVTARMVAELLPGSRWESCIDRLRRRLDAAPHEAARPAGPCLFDPARFMRQREPSLPGTVLPRDWSVTSDSIAARLAEVLAADELVLLKSAPPPRDQTTEDAAAEDYVDRFFPRAIARLPKVRCVNLRDSSFPEWLLLPQTAAV